MLARMCFCCVTQNTYKHRHLPTVFEPSEAADYSSFLYPLIYLLILIILGRYAGEHGVLANKVYDHKLQRLLGYSEELFTQCGNNIPIFTMNQLNGKHSGSMMWPGGEFGYTALKIKATFAQPLTEIPWDKRIETVISWFKHKDTPANFVMMYLNQPDSQEHAFGPDSAEVS